MPASITAIMKNVERMQNPALIELWNQSVRTEDGERTPGQAWAAFIEAADAAKLADKIPGSVGRSFKARYASEALTENKPTSSQKTVHRVPAKMAAK